MEDFETVTLMPGHYVLLRNMQDELQLRKLPDKPSDAEYRHPLHIAIPSHAHSISCAWLNTDRGCYYCCDSCNYDRHICHGCGDSVSHLGHQFDKKTGNFIPHPCFQEAL